MKKIQAMAICAVAVCALFLAGCGKDAMTTQEAEKAIREELTRNPIMGVKIIKLSKFTINKMYTAKEAVKLKELDFYLKTDGLAAMESASDSKIYVVATTMDAIVELVKLNPFATGASPSYPMEGEAYFMLTRQKGGEISVMAVKRPKIEIE